MKDRLDILLVKNNFFNSREKAKAAIMAGIVYVDGQKSDKPGTIIKNDAKIFVKENTCPYVSRGGLKLEKAMNIFHFDLKNKICMDMGASTGGFTDCMLQNGASKIYAIDVGYGQLDYKLRIDNRVVNMEKTNIRYMDQSLIKEPIDFISIDVSFISLNLILPVAEKVLHRDGNIICLVKPQFEAGKDQVGKKGIVRDKKVHIEVIKKVMQYAQNANLKNKNLTYSPVTGAKGNIEYLLYLDKHNDKLDGISVESIVEEAHKTLYQ